MKLNEVKTAMAALLDVDEDDLTVTVAEHDSPDPAVAEHHVIDVRIAKEADPS